MDDNLKNIPEDKKEAILKAALEEFATRDMKRLLQIK